MDEGDENVEAVVDDVDNVDETVDDPIVEVAATDVLDVGDMDTVLLVVVVVYGEGLVRI